MIRDIIEGKTLISFIIYGSTQCNASRKIVLHYVHCLMDIIINHYFVHENHYSSCHPDHAMCGKWEANYSYYHTYDFCK